MIDINKILELAVGKKPKGGLGAFKTEPPEEQMVETKEPYVRRTPVGAGKEVTPKAVQASLQKIIDWSLKVPGVTPSKAEATVLAKMGGSLLKQIGDITDAYRIASLPEGHSFSAKGQVIRVTPELKKQMMDYSMAETQKAILQYHVAPKAFKGLEKYWSPKLIKVWNKFGRRLTGTKVQPRIMQDLWTKLNTPGSQFSDDELRLVSQLEDIAKEEGTSIGTLFKGGKNVYVKGVQPTPTIGKGELAFRPAPAVTPEAKYGITPAGELAPKATTMTTPTPGAGIEPAGGLPTFLGKKTPVPFEVSEGQIPTFIRQGKDIGILPVEQLGGVPKEPIVPAPTSRPEGRYPYYEKQYPTTKIPEELAEYEPVMKQVSTKEGLPPTPRGEVPTSEWLEPQKAPMKRVSLGGELPPHLRGMIPGAVEKEMPAQIKPKHLTAKIQSLELGKDEGRILDMVRKGQQMAAREAFYAGKKAGTIKTDEEWEQWLVDKEESTIARQRVAKAKDIINEAFKQAKYMRPIARDFITSLKNKLDIKTPTSKTLNELNRIADFMKQHPEHDMPQAVIDKLNRLSKRPIKDMTVEELEDVATEVQAHVRQSNLINKMIIRGRLQEAEEVVGKAVENIRTKAPGTKYDPNEISSDDFEKRAGTLRQLAGVKSYNAELISEILDHKGDNTIHDIMYKGIDEGTDKMLSYQHGAHDYLKTELNNAGIKDLETWSRAIGGKRAKPIEVRISKGRKIKMTKAERVAFILHAFNEKNVKHLIEGGFAFEHNKTRIFRNLSKEDLVTVIRGATPEELKLVRIFQNAINNMGNELNKTSMSLYGREIFTEPNYWRIQTNELDRHIDALKTRSFGHKTLEGMGFLKERRNAQNAIVIEDAFTTLYKHIKQTSAFNGLAEPLRNAKMLLYDKGFRNSVATVRGGHYWRALQNYLKDVEGDVISTSDIEKIATKFVNKIDLAVLGMNPFVMLKQPVSYIMAATEMPAKYLLRAAVTRPDFDEIAKWSPQLRDRLEGNVTRELGELGQVGTVRKFFTGKSPVSHGLMAGIRTFDLQTIGRVWNAAKFEIAEKFPNLQGNEYMLKVKERAEEVIRKTQPTFAIKDRSEIGRDRSLFVRLATKYTSQRNKNYMQLRRAWEKYATSDKTPKAKAELLSRWATIVIANAVAIEGINELRNLAYKRKATPLTFALNAIGTAMGNMYVVGDLFKSIASKYEKGTFGYDLNNPFSSAVQDVIDAIGETGRAITQVVTEERYKSGKQKDELKWKTTAMRASDKGLTGIGMFTGIPYRTLRSMVEGGYRWIKPEKEEKENKKPSMTTQRIIDLSTGKR